MGICIVYKATQQPPLFHCCSGGIRRVIQKAAETICTILEAFFHSFRSPLLQQLFRLVRIPVHKLWARHHIYTAAEETVLMASVMTA
jgi:hypothetical protein